MKRNLITSLTICVLILAISPKVLAQPVITGDYISVYNHIHGSGEGAIGEITYRFEIFIDAIGNLSDIKPEDIRLSANEEVLDIDEVVQVEGKGDNLFSIWATGPFEEIPTFGEYVVTIEDGDGQTSAPFVIGVLEDYPKDAPEMLYPEHGRLIAEIQPTFRWEEFKSVYLGEPVESWAYEINLTFPNGDSFTVWPIPGDQTTLDYDNPDWMPSQPPIMLPGIYSLTVHSNHSVASGFGFQHHRTIQFGVLGALIVQIDIKPQSCPNPLNVKSQGVLPVAILGSEDFDVGMIDVATIRLAGVAPIRSSYEDVAAPVWDRQEECECTTEGPDGYLDLTLKFETKDIVEALGEVVDGEELMLTLTGALLDETPIEGADCIIVLSKGGRGKSK